MEEDRLMESSIDSQAQAALHYRHNFIVNFLDGSFFWFAYSFIAPAVILPLFVSHFTEDKLVIGFVAVIGATGYFLPQLFTANWIQQLPRKKFAPVNLGFFTERVPMLLLPVATLVSAPNSSLSLVLFFLLYSWHAFGAGLVAVGWQDMLAKIIPTERRGFFMGLTTFSGAGTGVLGAIIAARMLDRYAFPYGFVICFAVAGIFIFVSWIFLAMTREVPDKSLKRPISQEEYLRGLPGIVKKDLNFQRFIISQVFIQLSGMAWGFMAVYARQNWNLTDGKVGSFTTALLIGNALGNLAFGVLGDRRGYKLVLMISTLAATLALGGALVSPNPDWFYLIFGLRGLSLGGFFLSSLIALEFSPPDIRPTYIGVNNTTIGVAGAAAPLLGGWLANVSGYPFLFMVALALGAIGFILLTSLVREPRHPPLTAEGG
jgi:MFS family permease